MEIVMGILSYQNHVLQLYGADTRAELCLRLGCYIWNISYNQIRDRPKLPKPLAI